MKASLLVFTLVAIVLPTPLSETAAHADVGPGVRRCFEVDGSPGDAAVVNLTPVLAQGQGYGVLVSSDSDAAPNASNVNYGSGSVDPNVAIAPIGADGRVCFENGPLAGVDLVADHLGTIDAAVYRSATASGAPRRLIDTRQSAGRVGPGVRRCFEVAGSPGDAAVVNLTPVLAQGQGYGVLVSSDSDAAPNASNVNYGSGSVDPNVAIAPIGADGRVCFENGPLAGVDLVADHLGTIDAAVYRSATASGAPRRLLDTRQSEASTGGIATWLDAATGSSRQPTVVIDSAVYPNSSGVQFLINGEIDERHSARPGGFDATGPQEDSKYHVYPDVALSAGDVIEAKWTDRGGAARSSTWTVGSAAPGRVGPGVRRCFEVDGSPGDAAVVNLTPVLAQGQGYGVLVSSDSDAAPNASNVNYGSGSVDPNVAIAPVGADGRVCFENGPLAGVDLVADHLGTIDAAVYRSATASGAPRRLIDTRQSVASPAPSTKPSPAPSTKPSPAPSTKPSPAPAPSTKPSPVPSLSSSDVTHGSQLTAENTGVRGAGYVYDRATDTFSHPVHGPLRQSGTIRTSYDGQVIENVDVRGAILVEHDNVTIRNCRVRYSGTAYGINARGAGQRGTLIEFCDVTHVGSEPYEAFGLYMSHGTARFLNLYTWQAAFIVGAETRIEYSRVTDMRSVAGTHGTGGSADGGSNIVFYRNYMLGNTSSTLALYSRSPFNGVLIEDNYFDASTTPSFCLNAGSNKNGVTANQNIRIRGNVFGTTKYPECGAFGAVYNWDPSRPGAQWCNNRWTDGRAVGKETGC